MKSGRSWLVCAVLALAAFCAARWVAESPPRYPFLLGGIQVNEPDHVDWTRSLKASGLDTVAVTVYAKQGDWSTDHLWWEAEEPYVVAEIREAKRRGLQVVLILRVALDHAFPENRFLWHGMIHPPDDEALERWFEGYREFALRWARLAAEEKVDLFGVGSEMSALTSTVEIDELPALEEYYLNPEKQNREAERLSRWVDEIPHHQLRTAGGVQFASLETFLEARSAAHRSWAERTSFAAAEDPIAEMNRRRALLDRHWRQLIAEVRLHYPGRLTYAANFDQYQAVGFWDSLDVIGINAYFPLRAEVRPVERVDELAPELLAGWRTVLEDIDTFRADHDLVGRPVVFTELGLTPLADSTVHPWASSGFSIVPAGEDERLIVWGESPPRPSERVLALRALAQALAERPRPLLGGILWWKLSSKEYHASYEPFMIQVGRDSADRALPALEALGALGATRTARRPAPAP